MLDHVKVPKKLEPVFRMAQDFVQKYFSTWTADATKGTIEISGERYLLVRAASMSVDFFETVKDLYKDVGKEEAWAVAQSLLFDIAHAIGKADARNFHKKMKLTDPVEKLSAGPVHFAYAGWAFVDIFPESKPSPDDDCYLIYDHPYSFESDAWLRAGKHSDFPVCVMNAGYSSGWTEESFGVTLVSTEVMCKARGDEACRFIMAHPAKIEKRIKEYLKKKPKLAKRVAEFEIPGFFKRKKIETTLRESEDRYRRLFEQSNDAIFIHTTDGVILDVNGAACDMLGYTRDELLAKSIAKLHPDVSLAESHKAFEEVQGEGATRFESRFERSDGTILDVDISARIVDPSRDIVQGIVRDITDRKRVERELIQKERQLRVLAESSVDMIFVLNKSGTLQYVSPSSKDIVGYDPDELVGTSFVKYVPKREITTYWNKLGEVFIHKRVSSFETLIKHRDGRLIPVEINGRITQHDGQFVAQGTMRDITERKHTEEEIRKFKTISDRANYGTAIVDLEGNIIYINDTFARDHGYEPDELMGKNLSLFHNKAQLRRVLELNERMRAEGSYTAEEVWHVTKDGREFPMLMNGVIIRNEGGHPLFMTATAIDISERKRAEEELRTREEEFRLIFENAKDAIFWADPQTGLIINCNKGAEKLLERDKDEIIGMHQRGLHPPEGTELYTAVFREHLKNRGAVDANSEVVTATGRRIPVNITASITTVGGRDIMQGIFHDMTESKNAQRALAESEKKYRAIFETSPEAIVLLDTEGYVIDVNDRIQEVLGFNPDDIRGKHLLEMPTLTEESRRKGLEAMRRRIKGEKIPPYELDFVTRDDERRIGMIRASELKDEQGTVIADLIMISDITEQKAAEEALRKARDELEDRVLERTAELRKSQQRYQTLAETAEDFIFIIGDDLTVQYVNQYGMRALGQPRDEVMGKRVDEVFGTATGERFVAGLKRVFESGELMQAEETAEFPTGHVWLNTKLIPLTNQDGKIDAIMGLSRDVTESKEAEEALQESETRYRGLFEDSPISLWEEDFSEVKKAIDELRAAGVSNFIEYFGKHPEAVAACVRLVKINDINRATLDLYGADSKDTFFKGLESVFSEQSYGVFTQGLAFLAEGRLQFESEAVNRRFDGEEMYITIKWTVAPGYEDDFSKVLVSIMDITERKRLEDEIRGALKFKSDFMATMSHELRTPLSSIIACADLVLKDKTIALPQRRMENMKNILGSSDRLISMINNILDMARIEAGRVPLRVERFTLEDVVRVSVEYCTGLIGEKDIRVTQAFDEGAPQLHTDREKLLHILTNLVGNAIKFTDAGEITISGHARDREHVVISVADTGIGIPEEKLSMIFDQFKQADVSTTRRHGGIGLGLAIVKAYVDMLGATIDVKSEVGKGSVFTVTLPIELPEDTPAEEM